MGLLTALQSLCRPSSALTGAALTGLLLLIVACAVEAPLARPAEAEVAKFGEGGIGKATTDEPQVACVEEFSTSYSGFRQGASNEIEATNVRGVGGTTGPFRNVFPRPGFEVEWQVLHCAASAGDQLAQYMVGRTLLSAAASASDLEQALHWIFLAASPRSGGGRGRVATSWGRTTAATVVFLKRTRF